MPVLQSLIVLMTSATVNYGCQLHHSLLNLVQIRQRHYPHALVQYDLRETERQIARFAAPVLLHRCWFWLLFVPHTDRLSNVCLCVCLRS